MAFTANDVKKLREMTGAGMMICKEALQQTEGNVEQAVEYLRKKGLASAEKKAGRATGDGLVDIAIAPDGKSAAMAEINCETDFVAKTDQFKDLVKTLAQWALAQGASALTPGDLPQDKADLIKQTIVKTGENIQFKRAARLATGGVIESYIHMGSKLGVLVELEGPDKPELKALGKELAMQVAASSPVVVSRTEVQPDMVEKEKEIYREQLRGSGKPEPVIEKIVTGKLDKFYSEICLREQAYIKDPQKKVDAVIKEYAARLDGPVTVKQFVRYRLGE
ncbi:MAG: translation elongation factor Ts [Candidatus Edwardsbacteria bacterium]|nr:translation elongation factor Ts [Candidatus Edwardsbacteria bacterium]